MQTPRTDILGCIVDLCGDFGDTSDRVLTELQIESLGRHQGAVLLGQRCPGLGQDAREVIGVQGP